MKLFLLLYIFITTSITIFFQHDLQSGTKDGMKINKTDLKRTQELLLEMDLSTEKKITVNYPWIEKNKQLIEKISVNDCILTREIRDPFVGLIEKKTSDLRNDAPTAKTSSKEPQKTWSFTFDPFVVNLFGKDFTKIDTRLQPALSFLSKKERDQKFESFKKLAQLCRSKRLQKLIIEMTAKFPNSNSNPNCSGNDNNQESNIPTSNSEHAGIVHDQSGNNRVATLSNGEIDFYERYQAIINAKKTIYMQVYLYRPELTGIEIADLLIKKRMEGVDVKIIVDVFNNLQNLASLKLYHRLMAAGIPVLGYSCQGLLDLTLIENRNLIRDFDYIQERFHDKFLVVDGDDPTMDSAKAIVGGVNISDSYFGVNKESKIKWRDQDVAVKGSILKDINNTFKRNLLTHSLKIPYNNKRVNCLNPFDPIKNKKEYLQFFEDNKKEVPEKKLNEQQKNNQAYAKHKIKLIEEGKLIETRYPNGKVEYQKVEPQYIPVKEIRFIPSRPQLGETNIMDAYIDLINNAKKEILIANAFFVPASSEFRDALKRANQRGVKIKILTNDISTQDTFGITVTGRSYYKDLVNTEIFNPDNEIEIYEWTGINRDEPFEQKRGLMHSKFMIVDGNFSLVGSHNLDPRSGMSSSKSSNKKDLTRETEDQDDDLIPTNQCLVNLFLGRNKKYHPGINSETAVLFCGSQSSEQLAEDFNFDITKWSRRVSKEEIEYYANPTAMNLARVKNPNQYQYQDPKYRPSKKELAQYQKEVTKYKKSLKLAKYVESIL
ncbi:MAG: phosphatidylserine/phosphatidylglycerophosphate/cardiolipin synthase family protein [Oligoflexia bacterium]|nr:phosphatidylserine/phosphatidylglycerophosphate/cardiolipin synthase family protein [Oligoflexia bacterium]